ncbi:hypothetical protein LTR67_001950 [Exophiala xenobiotica]
MKECSMSGSTTVKQLVPKTDTSWAAYGILLATISSEGLLFGISLSFGVFQNYYSNTLNFSDQSSWIGVLSAGAPFLGAPLITYFTQALAIPLQCYIFLGWILCFGGLLSSAFCHSLSALIATQGLMYGLGMVMLEMPVLIIFNTWFVRRRGLAFGILCGVTDLFGVGWTFLGSYLLHNYGMRTTFLVFAAISFFVPGFGLYFIRRRPSAADSSSTSPSEEELPGDTETSAEDEPIKLPPYYRRMSFYTLMAANLLQSLAFYLPFIYLPSYTTMLGYTTSQGTVVLAVANVAQVVGEIGFGRLSDKVNVHCLLVMSALTACLSTFFLWGFANSLAFLVVFALLFGWFASGFIALWPRMGTMFAEKDSSMIYSLMCFGRGIGSIASGPISAALLSDIPTTSNSLSAQEHFRPVINFVGACLAASAALGFGGWMAYMLKKRRSCKGHDEELIF